MPATKTWLKVMLWAIGLGAGGGVLAVLTGAPEVVSRAIGSCLLVAGAALVMMLTNRLIDRKATRPAGLLGVGLILAIVALSLALIWGVGDLINTLLGHGGWWDGEYLLYSTIGWLLLTGVPAMVFLRLTLSPANRHAGWTGLALAGLTLTLFMTHSVVGLLTAGGYHRNSSWRWLETGLWVGAMALPIVGCLINAPRPHNRPWRWVGVLAAVAALAMGIFGVWDPIATDLGERIAFTLISAAIVIAHANLMLACPVHDSHRWVVTATISAGLATAAWLNVLVHVEIGLADVDTMAGRIVAAGLILAAGGTLAVMILSRLHRPTAIEANAGGIDRLTLICPVCRRKQAITTGEPAACGGCGLRFQITVTEPRCPQCDYLLYHLTSDRCPECGHALTDPARAG